jgi:hypothetical protein
MFVSRLLKSCIDSSYGTLALYLFNASRQPVSVTGVTRWFIKPGVSSGERQNRLRQHGTLFIFCTKIFVKKKVPFHPAGGDIPRQTPLKCRHVVVGTRFCASAARPNAGNAALERQPLPILPTAFHGDPVKKSTPESRQTRDRLLHVSIGRFAFFAHVAAFVVQTPTA